MARYQQRRAFSIGPYYLGQRSGSPAWYRCWFDEGSGQTRRVSLLTSDSDEARRLLTEWYYANLKLEADGIAPERMKLAEVLTDYWVNHGCHVVSAENTRRAIYLWNEFWGEASVADVRRIERQEAFQAWLRRKGMAPASINRTLEAGRAAMRRAYKRGAISSAPFVQMVKVPRQAPRGRPLSVAELKAFYLGSAERHWHDIVLLMVGTGARPEAVYQLTREQIDFEAGLVDLNPPGREQTRKFRPVVRLPLSLAERFRARPPGPLVRKGYTAAIKRAENVYVFARRRARLGEDVNMYSLRHTVARHLRSAGVDAWEIQALLGHKRPGFEMTERYAAHDPGYLKRSSEVLDALCRELLAVTGEERINGKLPKPENVRVPAGCGNDGAACVASVQMPACQLRASGTAADGKNLGHGSDCAVPVAGEDVVVEARVTRQVVVQQGFFWRVTVT